MPTALIRAFIDLFSPRLRVVVVLSVALATASFLVLLAVVAVGLDHLPTLGWRTVNWFIDFLGAVGVLLLSWLLFPAMVTLMMGFFLERVAAVVEAAHYPGRGPPRDQSIREITATAIRFALASLALNLLALPIYFMLPVLNIAIYLGLNGYLLGRGYFETVALRRLDVGAVREARRHHAGRVFIGGVTLSAIFAVPFVNLVAPVIATAFMLHVFEEMRRRALG